MLNLANDIRSLSDFKRNTLDLLDRLRKTGHPLLLTINGKAELVVQDAEAYQALLDRVEAIEGIQRGLGDVKAGRTRPAREVFDRLRRKHGIPRWNRPPRGGQSQRNSYHVGRRARSRSRAPVWFNGLERAVLSLDHHP